MVEVNKSAEQRIAAIYDEAANQGKKPEPQHHCEYYRHPYPITRDPWETRYLSCCAFRWMFFRGGNSW